MELSNINQERKSTFEYITQGWAKAVTPSSKSYFVWPFLKLLSSIFIPIESEISKWTNQQVAVCILMTRVVSFTLVNVYEITDQKMGFQNYAKIAVHKPLPCLRVQAIAVFNLLLDCENARL